MRKRLDARIRRKLLQAEGLLAPPIRMLVGGAGEVHLVPFVSQIIELHHGRLTVDSEPGHGSVFSIHLQKMPALAEGAQVL